MIVLVPSRKYCVGRRGTPRLSAHVSNPLAFRKVNPRGSLDPLRFARDDDAADRLELRLRQLNRRAVFQSVGWAP